VGLRTVSDLIAHAGTEPKRAAVGELRLEIARDAQQNVSLLAPMVCAISSRVFDHANSNGSELARAPKGDSSFAGVFGCLDGAPVGRPERNVIQEHECLR